ncbi:MAG: DUF6894 family protein [Caulobacteraceae bacterium]
MARYYFHTEGSHRFHDETGHEFANENDLAAEALDFLAESLRHDQDSFWNTSTYRVVVTDADGLILYVLDLSGVEAPAIKRRRMAALEQPVQSP